MSITELAKPQGQWCAHCAIGKGCRIYGEHPPSCRSFVCGYLGWPVAGDHWFPARCKMVLVQDQDEDRLIIKVDPSRPGAWRESPFYDEIKHWAHMAMRDGTTVLVSVNDNSTIVLPDREVDLGVIADDERVLILERRGPIGPEWNAIKVKTDNPRFVGSKAGKFIDL